jgi:hypothetical protein
MLSDSPSIATRQKPSETRGWLAPAVLVRIATLACFAFAFATFGPDSCSGAHQTRPASGIQLLLGEQPPLAPQDAREVDNFDPMTMRSNFDTSRDGAWILLCATLIGLVFCAVQGTRGIPSIRLLLFPVQIWGLFNVGVGAISVRAGPWLALLLSLLAAVIDLASVIANLVARRARPPNAAVLSPPP